MSVSRRYAFSLVELAVVLVVVGLIVGGVLVGQNLIKSSVIAKYGRELAQYDSATGMFRQQYTAWPGDMLNATAYWGKAAGTGSDSTCRDTVSVDAKTCNGNGNHIISGPDAVSELNERFRFWQHLADAGLISGQYTGTVAVGGGTNQTELGTNVPRSPLESSGYSALSEYSGAVLASDYYNINAPINILATGAQVTNSDTIGPNLSALDALYIDGKFDDGKPAYGAIQSYKSTGSIAPGCTTSDTASTAVYNTTQSGTLCVLYFFLNQGKR